MFGFLRKHRIVVLFAALVIAAVLAWRQAAAHADELRVSFLDVGQGDAVFIAFPDGNQMLIDGGPDASVLSELSAVMPPWDRTIDVVVATHRDADHLAGLLDVLARYDVSVIVESGLRKDTALSASWDRARAEEGAQTLIVDRPMRLRFGESAAFDMVWPQESVAGIVREQVNEYGIVGILRYGETSTLLTADIERWAEGRILASGVPLDADVLKVAHHGSKTSTSEALLNAVTPQIAVISVGEGNRYGHPHPSVLERLERHGSRTYRTDRDGRVTLTSDGRAFRVFR